VNWSHYIPRANLPVARESSHLLSPRQTGQRGQIWKHVRDNAERGDKLTSSMAAVQRMIGMMLRRQTTLSRFHPFKIYQPSPFWPNSSSAFVASTSDTFWRTFRVRNGLVLTTTVLGLKIEGSSPLQYGVKGTDLTDLPYDESWLFRGDGVTEIGTVPEITCKDQVASWLFWVEVYTVSGATYAVLRYGADPTDPPATDYHDAAGLNPDWHSTNPWTSYPAPDSTHFIIGLVDTLTNNLKAIVRQVQTTDILAGGGAGGTPCPYG